MDIPRELIERLAQARRVAVLTGAGISAESGIPTFRDALTGLWANYDPQELATPEGFARNPKMVWEWYAARRASIVGVRPNPGHDALARLERRFATFTLVTQNIDSLHQRAGSREVVELHGNITRVKCSLEQRVVSDFAEGESPPRCPAAPTCARTSCGSAKCCRRMPWRGRRMPQSIATCFSASAPRRRSTRQPNCPLRALSAGATVVEINPERTALTRHVQFALQGPAGEVLPRLLDRLAAASA
ncbi:MAG: hypothetical protein M5R42_13260 [Rhodocyclaceae bacterium]|nr:hypothetical protein [Rhodocyclaceae bacterium]